MKYINTIFIITIVALTLNIQAQCIDDTHSPFEEHSWLSCNKSEVPAPGRGEGHWIMYNLGHNYLIDTLNIWNYNVWGQTGSGAKKIIVDYSSDNINWNEAGEFEVERAPGSWKYNSPSTIELGHIAAQYLLITIDETWDSGVSCAGIGEIKINVELPSALSNISDDQLKIYPNPTSDFINVDFGQNNTQQTLYILNSLGQIIMTENTLSAGHTQLNMQAYPDGLYYVMIRNAQGVYTEAFTKTSK